ncbi:hypothetical protein [Spirillospora sp. NPDC048819]|uniref:hypothetical protein n=1 Tax=Spirillospora sp. NPDC048819 TaxID=3155268 RepID=UPI0033D9D4A4
MSRRAAAARADLYATLLWWRLPQAPDLFSIAEALADAFDSRDRLTAEGRALHGARDALQAPTGHSHVIRWPQVGG